MSASTPSDPKKPLRIAAWAALLVVVSLSFQSSREETPSTIINAAGAKTTSAPSHKIGCSNSSIIPLSRLRHVFPVATFNYRKLQVVAPAAVPVDGGFHFGQERR